MKNQEFFQKEAKKPLLSQEDYELLLYWTVIWQKKYKEVYLKHNPNQDDEMHKQADIAAFIDNLPFLTLRDGVAELLEKKYGLKFLEAPHQNLYFSLINDGGFWAEIYLESHPRRDYMSYMAPNRYDWLKTSSSELRWLLKRKLNLFFDLSACHDRNMLARPSLMTLASEQGYFSEAAIVSGMTAAIGLFASTVLIWPYNAILMLSVGSLVCGYIGYKFPYSPLHNYALLSGEEALGFNDGEELRANFILAFR